MRRRRDAPVEISKIYYLSILYLRCPYFKRVLEAQGDPTFNSLFEMHFAAWREGSRIEYAFNSLFEMQWGYDYALKGIYLVTFNSLFEMRHHFVDHCAAFRRHLSFNSLFEMQKRRGLGWF